MKFILKFLDPAQCPHWDGDLVPFSDANIFHTVGWARTLAEAYGFKPFYAVWYEDDAPIAIVPMMEVRAVLREIKGVCLPFTDFCPMLSTGQVSGYQACEEISDFGRSQGWKSLELRGLEMGDHGTNDDPDYYVHELDLSLGEEHLFSQVKSSARRNVRKSEKQGVRIFDENNIKGLKEFIRLNSLTRREHGLPPQPRIFFDSLFKNVIQQGRGRILLAVHNGDTIASAVFMHFNGHAIYKYGASDKKFQSLRANNLLIWEAIRTYCHRGARTFHFGRTEKENTGLLNFKRGWGAVEKALQYKKYDYKRGIWTINSSSVSGFHTHLFSRMPIFALNFISRVLYRYMG